MRLRSICNWTNGWFDILGANQVIVCACVWPTFSLLHININSMRNSVLCFVYSCGNIDFQLEITANIDIFSKLESEGWWYWKCCQSFGKAMRNIGNGLLWNIYSISSLFPLHVSMLKCQLFLSIRKTDALQPNDSSKMKMFAHWWSNRYENCQLFSRKWKSFDYRFQRERERERFPCQLWKLHASRCNHKLRMKMIDMQLCAERVNGILCGSTSN